MSILNRLIAIALLIPAGTMILAARGLPTERDRGPRRYWIYSSVDSSLYLTVSAAGGLVLQKGSLKSPGQIWQISWSSAGYDGNDYYIIKSNSTSAWLEYSGLRDSVASNPVTWSKAAAATTSWKFFKNPGMQGTALQPSTSDYLVLNANGAFYWIEGTIVTLKPWSNGIRNECWQIAEVP